MMRELTPYLDECTPTHLAFVLQELRAAIEEAGFVRGQIAERKRDMWASIPDQSIQMKDRITSYSVADETAELARIEAQIEILRIEVAFIERLLDAGAR